MNSKSVFEKLEFIKVLTYISNYCITEKGKNKILSISPLISLPEIIKEGELITEAKEILTKHANPPIDYIQDLENILIQSTIEGALLESKKILEILKLAIISRNLFQFLRDNTEKNSHLKVLGQNLFVDKAFENYIQRIINENGEIKDNASLKLYDIRKEISSRKEELIRSVNKIVKQLKEDNLVREDYVTLRDGRIVLPIKAEHKRHIRGFIHSESSTGQTVYIEPEETLELNNDIISLTFSEKREIERILKEVTKRIGGVSTELQGALNTVTQADTIFGRAKYSIETIGCFPTIDILKPISIQNARHPILLKKFGRERTVPLTVNVNSQKVILITGPNAGGKTVVLKTIGLLHLMINSGIHIPCNPDSNFHFFKDILVDIGDEQSLEDDLSTFSSHLSNINHILKSASSDSLILLDEIGTGTDPAEGSALAAGILVYLSQKKSLVFATTHHGNLKIIAHDMPGFENAAMEFDHKNLKPTYKFKQGIPGSSYAFEIAKRIGLDEGLMSTAQNYLDSNKHNLENFLVKLEEKSQELEDQLSKAESENIKLNELSIYYKQNIDKLNKEKKEIIKRAKTEADDYLKDLNKKFEKIIKDLKESNANKEVIKSSQVTIKALKEKNKTIFSETLDVKDENEVLIVGDYVQIINTHTTGEIIEINKDKALLVSGGLKFQASLSDLVKTKREKQVKDNFVKLPVTNLSHRLDIRGEKPEEAEFEVIKFIDEAYVSGLARVEILHGKGTGALKKLVKEILKSHDNVKEFHFAPVDMGGDGITVAELK
ncbi:MAG: DNA mismatch repair protein MutS [Ignavibacteria bacterium RIFOXYB2_FULL_35_12]|nr:MAG: DNA mismatch repair protein MutS [Ignavibacteria bacterium GWA2_36_19]OGU49306.1 MAG: DNA mismatch repair protein MutS [Ignavibacteria bacterium GWC2_35_8]OGU57943.1 MAG: DNA mismatch repair protein MutS [Ignavibacteria bacterium GWF2_35_20]OGU79491.1 MAG: DNA mismatch repair protein MutS [Ignavibacteria bacterium RIFOXYA2_FULL_35_9]OGU90472.1 MAG: DNA mismatch repair protein MutS [Ignavibacteria bacterium RIFOXYC12_FULL_35_11]OGU91893.1 MAG: DNA mismatch repair protein MutS [Ignavibac